jgi:[acyl-carrier-protein] S-malonyltransferase
MLAFVFPGQGSQTVGMGEFLYNEFPICRETFNEASEAIGIDLKKLCFNSTDAELALTENTQPALLTVSTSVARVLEKEFNLKPQITAGHSIGEYASFVLGSVISFSDAVKAVRLRGQAMQSAVPVGEGSMIATLGLNEEQVQFLCDWAVKESGFAPLSPANFNCDGQIVISGNAKVLNWLKENFKPEILPGEAKRVKLIPLQVSAPFHCAMMRPAQEKMAAFFETISFKNSTLPIIQNFHAKPEVDANVLKSNLISQVSGAVKWTQTMQQLKASGAANIVECGNGSVLKGLFKKSDSDFFKVFSTNSLDDIKIASQLT